MATTKKHILRTRRGAGKLQFLSQDELKRLFAVINHKRDKVLFFLAYRHGLRATEIGLLQRTDVDLKQGRIRIHRLKGSLSAVYPLQPDVMKLLRAWLRSRTDASPYLFISNRGTPLDRRTLWCAMDTYGKMAGLPVEKRKFHALKHSIATHLLDAEADLAFVKHWLGHKNIQNTTIYAQLTTGRQDAEARKRCADHRI